MKAILKNGKIVEINEVETFYNGNVKVINLIKPTTFKTSVGDLNLTGHVFFHENGELEGCWLENPTQIISPIGKFEALSLLHFHNDGSLKSFYPSKDIVINNKKYLMTDNVCFDKNGNVVECKIY